MSMLVNSAHSRNRCFLWVSPTEVIAVSDEAVVHFVSLRHGDSEGWEIAAAVVAVVVLRHDGVGVVAADGNATKERVHIHDAEHHVKGVRSAVGQSEGADDCP